jgi:hypothetical protein
MAGDAAAGVLVASANFITREGGPVSEWMVSW